MSPFHRLWQLVKGRPEPPEALKARAETRAALAEKLARVVVERRLETPAVFFLEANRPFTFLASQGLLAAMPLAGLFAAPETVERYAEALDSEEAVDLLINRIQALAAERDGEAQPSLPLPPCLASSGIGKRSIPPSPHAERGDKRGVVAEARPGRKSRPPQPAER